MVTLETSTFVRGKLGANTYFALQLIKTTLWLVTLSIKSVTLQFDRPDRENPQWGSLAIHAIVL